MPNRRPTCPTPNKHNTNKNIANSLNVYKTTPHQLSIQTNTFHTTLHCNHNSECLRLSCFRLFSIRLSLTLDLLIKSLSVVHVGPIWPLMIKLAKRCIDALFVGSKMYYKMGIILSVIRIMLNYFRLVIIC